ncbi:hypothetical protein COP1_025830 [Malus domestica]
MQRHDESVEKQGGPSNRDDLLTYRYVRGRRGSFDALYMNWMLMMRLALACGVAVATDDLLRQSQPYSFLIQALHNRIETKDPVWKLASFIVDDPLADVLTILDVFQCSVLISFWRVPHAWHTNLVKKCVDNEMRATMSRRLRQAVDNICQQRGAERNLCGNGVLAQPLKLRLLNENKPRV